MIGEDGPPLVDPDRRYWRRRVNRNVRKSRFTRAAVRWSGIAAANAAVAGVLLFAGAGAVRHLTTATEFAVTTIVVEGATRTTPDAVRAVLAPWVGKNMLDVDLGDVAAAATRDPWVASASVRRELPATLRVTVSERRPAAVALVRGLAHVVDETGFVMGLAGPEFGADLPVVTGLDRLEDPFLSEAIARGVDAIRRIAAADADFAASISDVDLSEPDRIAVTTVTPGPRLFLDPSAVDRNLREWIAMGPGLARRVGELSYVDLRWDRRITLMPIETTSSNTSE